jgi:hypothetical protein
MIVYPGSVRGEDAKHRGFESRIGLERQFGASFSRLGQSGE